MNLSGGWLEPIKQIAQIASAVAVPLVLAATGYFVQASISDAGLKKDYVQMALGVLKEAPTAENKQLRTWAISVLDKNSPVAIPGELKAELATNKSIPFVGFSNFKNEDFQPVVTLDCKPVPDAGTLEWMLKTYPTKYERCADGQIGERKVSFPRLLDQVKDLSGTPATKIKPTN